MLFATIIVLWLVLFVVFWPLAIGALILVPILWVISIPFRIVFWVVEAVLRFIKAILFLPARLLGFGQKA